VEAVKVAAMDHLLHPVFEFKHQVPEPHGADFCDFLLHVGSPYFLVSAYLSKWKKLRPRRTGLILVIEASQRRQTEPEPNLERI
jgi:hypothetical protein